jgi:uncharacterized protein (TIGR03000 family)
MNDRITNDPSNDCEKAEKMLTMFKSLTMFRRMFWFSWVLASLALWAHQEASVVHAGPSSGGRSFQYRAGGGYSSSAPAAISAGDFTPASRGEPVFYAYYAPPARSSSGGEEESELGGQNAAAMIQLTVPANAEVWLDGHKTHQAGAGRSFITPPIQPGKSFSYDFRVRWTTAAGIVVDVTRPIQVRAGRQTMIRFEQ